VACRVAEPVSRTSPIGGTSLTCRTPDAVSRAMLPPPVTFAVIRVPAQLIAVSPAVLRPPPLTASTSTSPVPVMLGAGSAEPLDWLLVPSALLLGGRIEGGVDAGVTVAALVVKELLGGTGELAAGVETLAIGVALWLEVRWPAVQPAIVIAAAPHTAAAMICVRFSFPHLPRVGRSYELSATPRPARNACT
jgi:hypothetical protein